MLNVLRLGVTVVLLVGWALAGLSLHVVRTHGGVQLLTKNRLAIDDTYVDVRQWSREDEEKHAVLFARLEQLDKTELLSKPPATADESPIKTVEREVKRAGRASQAQLSAFHSARGR